MTEISVFSFSNPSEFLHAILKERKERTAGYSSSKFSDDLGFQSRNYLGLVMNGSRSLTNEHIHRIARTLRMNISEMEWFETIVHLSQAKGEEEKKYYKYRLFRLKSHLPKSSVNLAFSKLSEEWYFPAILVAADRCPENELANRISKVLPISVPRLDQVIQKFISEGLLKRSDGVITLNHSHQIFFDMKSMSAKHKKFLKAQIVLSAKMLERTYEKGSKFYSHTFSIQKDDFEYYENQLRKLLSDLTARSDETSADEVAQVNIQLFKINSSIEI